MIRHSRGKHFTPPGCTFPRQPIKRQSLGPVHEGPPVQTGLTRYELPEFRRGLVDFRSLIGKAVSTDEPRGRLRQRAVHGIHASTSKGPCMRRHFQIRSRDQGRAWEKKKKLRSQRRCPSGRTDRRWRSPGRLDGLDWGRGARRCGGHCLSSTTSLASSSNVKRMSGILLFICLGAGGQSSPEKPSLPFDCPSPGRDSMARRPPMGFPHLRANDGQTPMPGACTDIIACKTSKTLNNRRDAARQRPMPLFPDGNANHSDSEVLRRGFELRRGRLEPRKVSAFVNRVGQD